MEHDGTTCVNEKNFLGQTPLLSKSLRQVLVKRLSLFTKCHGRVSDLR